MSQDDDAARRHPTEPFDKPLHGQEPQPYGQQPQPYGQTAQPYGEAAAPYGQASPSHGATAQPYGQATPYGQPPQLPGQQPHVQPYGPPPYGYGYPPPQRTNGMAIASMVLGILWIYWIGSVLALVFGYVAKRQIRERGEAGGGMATAGIVLGWVGIGILAVILLFGVVLSSTSGFS
ncbi:DUF4190 domain-containing protein [Modestobacter muralis]|uniref:DUF4190 domain-containing protein n=1 Tax=Modestobacter muralis TaxID=1608614 RepID=A0A6P0ETB6_9ACTN|nr:DUF4190 domain-containing protein [Modestobacter muralis]NEK93749.1 DUF4190 domain-containing protein [Modestobacter muralis]NEN50516.1 DUF4190 domain-containing protein [Modestobacter muralis]